MCGVIVSLFASQGKSPLAVSLAKVRGVGLEMIELLETGHKACGNVHAREGESILNFGMMCSMPQIPRVQDFSIVNDDKAWAAEDCRDGA